MILAIETSTPVGSVALFEEGVVRGLIEYNKGKSHARLLTPMIQTLLKDLSLSPQDLKAVAVSSGPGSYTGLRIGVSTAKGLCMALDIPLISISSLECLAWQQQEMAAHLDAHICALIDARRMDAYCQVFDANVNPVSELEAKTIATDSFAEELEKGKIIFVGDGAAKCQNILTHPNAIILSESQATAQNIGKPVFRKYQTKKFENLVTLEPFYLKGVRITTPRNRLQ